MENNTNNQGAWDETKEKLKLQFNTLSCDDLQQLVNKQDEIITKIQVKLEKTKEEIYKLISTDKLSELIITPRI